MKYLSDGRKVEIVGKLNATETIVQEVFVKADGSQIPSGEQFVVKSLHDEPVESWKTKREREINANLERLEKELKDAYNRFRHESELARVRVQALRSVASAASSDSLKLLEDFVAGRITHVLADTEYQSCRIVPFDVAMISGGYQPYDALKLLSLFGTADGTLQWRIHQYSDGSGRAETVLPARSHDEARRMAQDVFDAHVDKWRKGEVNHPPEAARYLDVGGAARIPLSVPQDVENFYAKRKAAAKAALIADLESRLAAARAECQ